MGENGQRGPVFDHATYSSTGGVYLPAVSDHRFPPIDYDPPEHSAFRRLIAPLTSGAAAKAMEPRIRATVLSGSLRASSS